MPKDYKVGYKRPPAHTQFKKGQSGFPSGRPKKKSQLPSLDSEIVKALKAEVSVKENGAVRKITKFEAALTQLANNAARGHMPTMKLLMPYVTRLDEAADSGAAAESWTRSTLSARERVRKRLEQMAERLSSKKDNDESGGE
jgi:Family of unknown function (DUF5681)